MNEIVYLENDEEITSVIDRLRKTKQDRLALVIPRGGTLAQSIVNLKLLKRSAGEMGKEISLVSNDRISRNLASQIGLTVYSKAAEAEKAMPAKNIVAPIEEAVGDFKVNSYYGKDEEVAPAEESLENIEDAYKENDIDEDEDLEEISEDENIKDKESTSAEDMEDRPEKIKKEDIEKSYKEPEISSKGQVASSKEDKHEEKVSDNSGRNISHNIQPEGPKERKPMSRNKKIAIAIIAACLVLLLGVAYIFLPYASVKVMAKTEDLSLKEKIIIDPAATAINQDGLIVPSTAITLEKEVSKTFPTTGKKDEGTKATGKITISNSLNYDAVAFTKGTKFTSGDKAFISLADATVPGLTADLGTLKFIAGTVDVLVESENPGADYNIGPSDFTIGGLTGAKLARITGHSASAMTGGVTKIVNIVSEADFKAAEADLTKSITDLGKAELTTKAKDQNLEIIDSKVTSEVLSKEASKSLNDKTDNFDYRVNIKLSVPAYNVLDIKTVLTALANKNLASDKMLIGQEKFEVTVEYIGDVKVTAEETNTGAMEVSGTLKGKTGQKISDKEIKDKIKGKKYMEAQTIVERYSNANGSVIQIWPSSIARVPLLVSRIKVTFDYAQ